MNPITPVVPGSYRLATGLVGFRLHTELRVFVTHICTGGEFANVITADLADAGTRLTIEVDRLQPIDDPVTAAVSYQ